MVIDFKVLNCISMFSDFNLRLLLSEPRAHSSDVSRKESVVDLVHEVQNRNNAANKDAVKRKAILHDVCPS